MPASYCTAATLKAALGVGTLYDTGATSTWIEETCQTAQDLINAYINFNAAPVVSVGLQNNLATVVIANPALFVIGQSVTIAGCGATYNGSRTITGTGPYSTTNNNIFNATRYDYPRGYSFLQFAITASNDLQHLIQPYGTMTGPDTKTQTYANTPAINSAALIIAEQLWQARTSNQGGQNGMDGMAPSPYAGGSVLIASVRGLLAPYLSPLSMIG